jgi:hypothetical protein
MADDSVICAVLTKAVEKEVRYGDASLVTAEGGFQSVDVIGHFMPDLQEGCNSCGFILQSIDSGGILVIHRMVLLLGETNDWAGRYELGLSTRLLTGARIVVFSVSPDGSGPVMAYLAGTLGS